MLSLAAINLHVFPTCVGVNRTSRVARSLRSSVPHMRGGEPLLLMTQNLACECSPHAWG